MAETRVVAGGQAANVAAWASSLGAEARFVGRRGDDAAGEIIAAALGSYGVQVVGPVSGRTGVVVSIASDGDRTMASDRGNAPDLAPQDLDESWFDCDVLHVSGYSLLREPISFAAIEAARSTRRLGGIVAVDVSTWSLVDQRFRGRLRELAPDVVFATEREHAAVGDLETRWVLKRGADGPSVDAATTRRRRRGRRHDGRGRRAGRRLSRRRSQARPGSGRTLLRTARSDAVIVSDEVAQALLATSVVVAWETTLIAHGFPPERASKSGADRNGPCATAVLCSPRSACSTGRSASAHRGRARALRRPHALGLARPRSRRRSAHRRSHHRRRHSRRLQRRGNPLHGDRRARRGAPWLADPA